MINCFLLLKEIRELQELQQTLYTFLHVITTHNLSSVFLSPKSRGYLDPMMQMLLYAACNHKDMVVRKVCIMLYNYRQKHYDTCWNFTVINLSTVGNRQFWHQYLPESDMKFYNKCCFTKWKIARQAHFSDNVLYPSILTFYSTDCISLSIMPKVTFLLDNVLSFLIEMN